MSKVKLFKIYQDTNTNYDTYDSAIVCAENEEEARRINPGSFHEIGKDDKWYFVFSNGKREQDQDRSWTDIENVRVIYIGEAKEGTEKGLILASFNAG